MQIKCINDHMGKPYLKIGQVYTIDPIKDVYRPYKDVDRDFYIIHGHTYDSKRFEVVNPNP